MDAEEVSVSLENEVHLGRASLGGGSARFAVPSVVSDRWHLHLCQLKPLGWDPAIDIRFVNNGPVRNGKIRPNLFSSPPEVICPFEPRG